MATPPELRAELVARLETRRDALLKAMSSDDTPDYRDEEGDPAATELYNRRGQMLRQIEVALVRLKNGSYGHCTDCGGDIAEARLRVLQTVDRCTNCQRWNETVLYLAQHPWNYRLSYST